VSFLEIQDIGITHECPLALRRNSVKQTHCCLTKVVMVQLKIEYLQATWLRLILSRGDVASCQLARCFEVLLTSYLLTYSLHGAESFLRS